MKLSLRTRLYLRFVIPFRVRLRNRVVRFCERTLDRLEVDKFVYDDTSAWLLQCAERNIDPREGWFVVDAYTWEDEDDM